MKARDFVPLRIHSPGPSVEVLVVAGLPYADGFPSLGNSRKHHMTKAKIAADHVQLGGHLARLAMLSLRYYLPEPFGLVLTRLSEKLLDPTNVYDALKSVQDGAIRWMSFTFPNRKDIHDGPGSTIYCVQEKSTRKGRGCRLEIGRIIA